MSKKHKYDTIHVSSMMISDVLTTAASAAIAKMCTDLFTEIIISCCVMPVQGGVMLLK